MHKTYYYFFFFIKKEKNSEFRLLSYRINLQKIFFGAKTLVDFIYIKSRFLIFNLQNYILENQSQDKKIKT